MPPSSRSMGSESHLGPDEEMKTFSVSLVFNTTRSRNSEGIFEFPRDRDVEYEMSLALDLIANRDGTRRSIVNLTKNEQKKGKDDSSWSTAVRVEKPLEGDVFITREIHLSIAKGLYGRKKENSDEEYAALVREWICAEVRRLLYDKDYISADHQQYIQPAQ